MIFHTLSAVLFLLKVLDVIDISWWLVLAPSLLVLGFTVFMVLAAVLWAWRAYDADKRD